jgi:hypothetical protein
MAKLPLILGAIFGVATWFLLFVILGIGLGTSFIAGGCVLAAGVLAGALVFAPSRGLVLGARLTNTGLVFGIATFVVLEVVLSSVPMWVGVLAALTVIGIYDAIEAPVRERALGPQARSPQPAHTAGHNGHDRTGEPVLAR